MIHKLSALLLALLFCATALPVYAAADVTVTVGEVTAKAGDTVVVPVSVSHVENIAGVGMHVWYDPAVLKCVDATMCDVVAGMNMANANTKPINHPNEIFLTAVGLKGVVLDGVVMTVTFEVLADAPDGVAAVKVLDEGLAFSTTEMKKLSVDVVNGGVSVGDIPAATTSVKETMQTTTTTGKSTDVQSEPTTVTEPQGSATQGEQPAQSTTATTVELPEETVVDIAGNIVTNANGEPTKVKAIGVFISSATATTDDVVTIRVSLSDVTDLTAIGLAVHYNATALSFESGECVGFVKESASMSAVVEHESGVVDISAMAATGMSGNGDIAELRFKVKSTAKNGDHRLSIKGNPLLQSTAFEYPVKAVAGKITVEGALEGAPGGLVAAIGVVIVAALAAVIVWLSLRRKKNAPVDQTPKAPAMVDVSGEDDE